MIGERDTGIGGKGTDRRERQSETGPKTSEKKLGSGVSIYPVKARLPGKSSTLTLVVWQQIINLWGVGCGVWNVGCRVSGVGCGV